MAMDKEVLAAAEAAMSVWRPGVEILSPVEALADYEGARYRVFRCRLGSTFNPNEDTVVIKYATPRSGLIQREWAALDFIWDTPHLADHIPALIYIDTDLEFAVIEDLGDKVKGQLGEILHGNDRALAVEALISFNQKLAEIHARTAGQEGRWDQYQTRFRVSGKTGHKVFHLVDTLDAFRSVSGEWGLVVGDGMEQELGRIRDVLLEPGSFLSLTHGDATPANFFYTPGEGRFFDWETAEFRHCMLDGAFSNVRYLHSVWAKRIPAPVLDAMHEAYRTTLAKGNIEAAFDAIYFPQMAACSLAWLGGILAFYPRVREGDARWGRTTLRQRIFTALEMVRKSESVGNHFPGLAGQVDLLADRLRESWPNEDRTLPLYPVFDTGEDDYEFGIRNWG